MDQRQRALAASAGAVVLFLAVQVGALALVRPFEAAGYQQVQNPQDPTNSLLYVGLLLLMTGVMLAVIKAGRERVLRYFIVFTSALVSWYVFSVVVPPAAALGGAALVAVALLVHPEWYVVDAAGVLMGMGAAALFGISFGVLPAVLLLVVLAVYDAISVYRTEHMLTLAEGVMDLKVPVLFVVPTRLDYSFRAQAGDGAGEDEASEDEAGEDEAGPDGTDLEEVLPAEVDPEDLDDVDDVDDLRELDEPPAELEEAVDGGDGGERDPLDRGAIFVGLGDAVMPTIMAASAAFFLDAPQVLGVEVPALLAVVGTQLGLLVLLRMVLEGKPHAGLPLLNGGAIGGYLLGAVLSGYSLVHALGLGPYL